MFRVGQHSHESGPNGPATWAGPYGPSKYYGILWYVAVIYGMETDRFVSRITIIQVICHHRHFSQQSDMCSINLSVIHIYIYIQAEPWWRASIWRSHRKVVIKQCSYHNNIIDIQNRLPYSKVVYPAIIVLFSCLMEVNHGVRTGPDYPFR